MLLWVTAATTTFAGVKEFNAAMSRGDFKSAAREADTVWNAADQNQPAAVTLAREMAFVNYLAGDFEKARTYINYLTGGEKRLTAADDQPDVSNILSSLIEYRINEGEAQRNALVHHIERRLQRDGVDIISLTGAEYLYSHDWARGAWIQARDSARHAVELLKRSGPGKLDRQRNAEAINVVAGFLADKEDTHHYNNMVDLHDAVVTDSDQMQDERVRAGLVSLKWLLHAWIKNVEALYTVYDWKLSKPVTGFQPRSLKSSEKGNFYEQSGAAEVLPVCRYSLDTKRLFFPQSDAYRDQIGTVIFKMDVDANGKVTNAVPLSAVPEQRYQMLMERWGNFIKVRRATGQSEESCRLHQKNAIVPVSFEIQKVERRRR
jgi:hypothetical protein